MILEICYFDAILHYFTIFYASFPPQNLWIWWFSDAHQTSDAQCRQDAQPAECALCLDEYSAGDCVTRWVPQWCRDSGVAMEKSSWRHDDDMMVLKCVKYDVTFRKDRCHFSSVFLVILELRKPSSSPQFPQEMWPYVASQHRSNEEFICFCLLRMDYDCFAHTKICLAWVLRLTCFHATGLQLQKDVYVILCWSLWVEGCETRLLRTSVTKTVKIHFSLWIVGISHYF